MSALIQLQFVVVLDVVSEHFRKQELCELLYAADLEIFIGRDRITQIVVR